MSGIKSSPKQHLLHQQQRRMLENRQLRSTAFHESRNVHEDNPTTNAVETCNSPLSLTRSAYVCSPLEEQVETFQYCAQDGNVKGSTNGAVQHASGYVNGDNDSDYRNASCGMDEDWYQCVDIFYEEFTSASTQESHSVMLSAPSNETVITKCAICSVPTTSQRSGDLCGECECWELVHVSDSHIVAEETEFPDSVGGTATTVDSGFESDGN